MEKETLNQEPKAWEPSDGTPGRAAEPQSEEQLWREIKTAIPGPARIIFSNPGRSA